MITTPPTFVDTELGRTCVARAFSDDGMYCLPSGASRYVIKSHFKDAACTQPILVVHRCGGHEPPVLLYEGEDRGCPGDALSAEVFPLGPRYDLTTYYDATFGTCEERTSLDSAAHDVLAPVPVSTLLAKVTRERE